MSASLLYGRPWRRISEAARQAQPWCSFCRIEAGEEYMTVDGTIRTVRLTVDHINGDTANSEPTNLRVLCDACHGTLTAGNEWR